MKLRGPGASDIISSTTLSLGSWPAHTHGRDRGQSKLAEPQTDSRLQQTTHPHPLHINAYTPRYYNHHCPVNPVPATLSGRPHTPSEASMSFRSSLSMNPSLLLSITLKAYDTRVHTRMNYSQLAHVVRTPHINEALR